MLNTKSWLVFKQPLCLVGSTLSVFVFKQPASLAHLVFPGVPRATLVLYGQARPDTHITKASVLALGALGSRLFVGIPGLLGTLSLCLFRASPGPLFLAPLKILRRSASLGPRSLLPSCACFYPVAWPVAAFASRGGDPRFSRGGGHILAPADVCSGRVVSR